MVLGKKESKEKGNVSSGLRRCSRQFALLQRGLLRVCDSLKSGRLLYNVITIIKASNKNEKQRERGALNFL